MSSVVCKQRPLPENDDNISENSIAMTLTQTIFKSPYKVLQIPWKYLP